MSNSSRAEERRSKRSRASKHQRLAMSSQHSGDSTGTKRSEMKSTKSIPDGPSLIERKMQELRDRL